MSKFTGVDGWAAAAKAVRSRMVTPAAMEARRILRLVNIVSVPDFHPHFHCAKDRSMC
jgi:hypothetical protein